MARVPRDGRARASPVALRTVSKEEFIMALPVRVARGQGGYPFDLMQREFDDALGRFFGGRDPFGDGGGLAPLGVDIREDANQICVEADLPGFKKEEVDVSLENGTLTISAAHREETPAPGKEEKKGEYLLRERRCQRFLRSFTLPSSVDEQQVNANFKDGLLTITLNKREETKPKKIQLQ
jgi:HSP20 family protein